MVRVRTLPTEWRTPISKLSALQGPHQQIAEVIDRLTCSTCGRKPTHGNIARNSTVVPTLAYTRSPFWRFHLDRADAGGWFRVRHCGR